MRPLLRDLEIWKGNDFLIQFRLFTEDETGAVVPLPLDGAELVALFEWDQGSIRLAWPNGALNVLEQQSGPAVVEIALSAAQTRALPRGTSKVRWELEWRIGGTEQSILYGTVKVNEWVNDDA